jgi:hypothetical protein
MLTVNISNKLCFVQDDHSNPQLKLLTMHNSLFYKQNSNSTHILQCSSKGKKMDGPYRCWQQQRQCVTCDNFGTSRLSILNEWTSMAKANADENKHAMNSAHSGQPNQTAQNRARR